jgi:AcrR family transcriptional regulator
MARRPDSSAIQSLRVAWDADVSGEPAARAEVVTRGPNAVRRAATREKILDAAAQCVLEFGYQRTTTLMVQERAGVSRGSLLHQFPSKADLMAAVLDRITLIRHYAYQDEMRATRDDRRRFELLVDVLWAQISQPAGFVRLEIMVAAYSEPELLRRIAPDNTRTDRLYRGAIWSLAKRLGVRDRAGLDLAVTVFVAALRGLALDVIYPRPGVDVDGALALIKRNHMAAVDRLIAEGATPPD